jgi:hypothetical protein
MSQNRTTFGRLRALVGDDTEEFADFHTEPGFFDHLAPRP